MNRSLRLSPLLALAVSGLVLLPACAQGGSKPDKAEIEKIVEEYILANPEIIERALVALTEKERQAQADATKAAIADSKDALYNHAGDYSIGPADAPITVVEFFDYRCGYCKRSAAWTTKLPETYDGQVRVVFKEYPIFGGISETAALAALSAGRQGKYLELHMAFMNLKSNDELTEEKIDELALKLGLDVQRLRSDMKSDAVKQQLAEMQALGRKLNVGGTPGYFIGDQAVEGANFPKIEEAIRADLEG
ncbi:DsbA family protein [Hyphomonas sp. WL0036]|uniref:DsbA family protein n=1 Tax=Hyphomonas sediminis TaxID=2866160 RepID=UPI001C812947|nr:DsbA family protein [Hyphomonas sediminis]MBY9068534.1 DsbA family protein [Hyphomonas sediminis]